MCGYSASNVCEPWAQLSDARSANNIFVVAKIPNFTSVSFFNLDSPWPRKQQNKKTFSEVTVIATALRTTKPHEPIMQCKCRLADTRDICIVIINHTRHTHTENTSRRKTVFTLHSWTKQWLLLMLAPGHLCMLHALAMKYSADGNLSRVHCAIFTSAKT